MLTPLEQQELLSIGVNTTMNMINTIITSTGYGVMVLMMFVAMHYLSKKQRTIPVIALATCSIVMFLLFTIQYIYYSGFIVLAIAAATDESPQQAASYARTAQYLSDMAFSGSQPGLMFLVGDMIVVWRAWVLLPTGRFYRVILSVLMLANAGIIIADTVLDYIQIQLGTLQGLGYDTDWLMCVSTLLINLFATLLIVWKLWTHQRSILGRSSGHHIQKILIVLIESGALMGITQTINLALTTVTNYRSHFTLGERYTPNIFSALAMIATAWYPIAVIILVNTGNSPVYATVHFTDSDVLEDPQSIHH
ncbi:hypothetical protein D9757_011502 [Collybiopsis confluens]|uniref:Uncharacterized protein n=1 Tax=Collybiopsis confluens TaxID=2823264 RepID=A0A8H5GVU9_9AGAR|nr:hypothetical protein D9757_011502 [Collybiopsis confluens]